MLGEEFVTHLVDFAYCYLFILELFQIVDSLVKYNNLLQDAVLSIMEVKEENDLESLFKVGSKVLFQQGIDGLDDFELISFVVIR